MCGTVLESRIKHGIPTNCHGATAPSNRSQPQSLPAVRPVGDASTSYVPGKSRLASPPASIATACWGVPCDSASNWRCTMHLRGISGFLPTPSAETEGVGGGSLLTKHLGHDEDNESPKQASASKQVDQRITRCCHRQTVRNEFHDAVPAKGLANKDRETSRVRSLNLSVQDKSQLVCRAALLPAQLPLFVGLDRFWHRPEVPSQAIPSCGSSGGRVEAVRYGDTRIRWSDFCQRG